MDSPDWFPLKQGQRFIIDVVPFERNNCLKNGLDLVRTQLFTAHAHGNTKILEIREKIRKCRRILKKNFLKFISFMTINS